MVEKEKKQRQGRKRERGRHRIRGRAEFLACFGGHLRCGVLGAVGLSAGSAGKGRSDKPFAACFGGDLCSGMLSCLRCGSVWMLAAVWLS